MDEYVLPHRLAGEQQRLALMSELLDPLERGCITRLGISPGWCCLKSASARSAWRPRPGVRRCRRWFGSSTSQTPNVSVGGARGGGKSKARPVGNARWPVLKRPGARIKIVLPEIGQRTDPLFS